MKTHKITHTYRLQNLKHLDFANMTLDQVEEMVNEYMGANFRSEYAQEQYPCMNINRGNHYERGGSRDHTFINFEFGLNVPDDEAFMFCIQH